jgi:hypothetical protein
MGSLLTNSLASGAANAFLTLRVGLMAQAYCAPLQRPEHAAVRRSATVRAAGQLGQLVREAGSSVSQAVYGRMRDAVSQTAQSAVDSVRQSGQTVVDATRDAARSAASTSGAWVDQATGKLHQATLQVADHTARRRCGTAQHPAGHAADTRQAARPSWPEEETLSQRTGLQSLHATRSRCVAFAPSEACDLHGRTAAA